MKRVCSKCGTSIGRGKTGLCIVCWRSYNRGENASNWKGGFSLYKTITINGRQVMEHRLVWEQANGKIPNGWVIHHLNGNRKDNRLENLLALPNGQHWSNHGRKASRQKFLEDALRVRIRELEKSEYDRQRPYREKISKDGVCHD